MKSVKSFRIDDILMDSKKETKCPPRECHRNEDETSTGKSSPYACSSSSSSSEESNSSSPKYEGKEKSSPSLLRTPIMPEMGQRAMIGIGASPPGMFPFHAKFPMVSHQYERSRAMHSVHPYAMQSLRFGMCPHPHTHPHPHSHGLNSLNQIVPGTAPLPIVQNPYGPPPPPPRNQMPAFHPIFGHYYPKHGGYPDKREYPTEGRLVPLYSLTRPPFNQGCKRKGGQIRFNTSQTAQLEKAFVKQKYLNANDRKKLASSLGLSDRQVKTWFQNRRAKLRKCKDGSAHEEIEVCAMPQDLRTVRFTAA